MPKIESTLLMWMRPEISAHIVELTQIAETAHFGWIQADIQYKKDTLDIKEKHRFELEGLNLKHSQEVATLNQRIHDLESRFIKDSHNSHKPPSTDGFKKSFRTQSLREKTGRRTGGQPGHRGHFKEHSDRPDDRVVHLPHSCESCKKPLRRSGTVKTVIRQIWDIRDGKLYIAEHQALTKKCSRCGLKNRADFPKEVTGYICYGPHIRSLAVYFMVKQLVPFERTTQIFKDLYAIGLSEGTLFRILSQTSKALKPNENELKKSIINSKVAHFDESGVRVNGKLKWLHTATADGKTLYSVHDKRGFIAMSDIGILSDFKGTAIHDGFKAYFKFDCDHGLCNVHHLRELTFVHEFENEPWAKEMKEFLKDANQLVRELKGNNLALTQQEITDLKAKYTLILHQAYRFHGSMNIPDLNPTETGPPVKIHKGKQKTGKNLLDRLNRYKSEVLAFLNGLIPFSNNSAEQAIRMAKVKQKISGCFRSPGGAMMFYRIRSFMHSTHFMGAFIFKKEMSK